MYELKFIPEYEGQYSISEDGKVWAHPRYKRNSLNTGYVTKGKWLKLIPDFDGYSCVTLKNKDLGLKGCFKVHRLVGRAFIPNPLNLPEINHKNKDRADNRVENLEWVDRQQNIDHQFAGYHRPKVTCPHCGKMGANNVMSRFHFDNCKFK